jgi:peptide-methionine (S)-S-oxide reductase
MGNAKSNQRIDPTIINLGGSMISKAVVGGGCFWCIEAVLQRLRGVQKVESGYAGGQVKNPTYQAVCSGQTGHAEVCRIHFDPKVISYSSIFAIDP